MHLKIGMYVYWLEQSVHYNDDNTKDWEVEHATIISFDEESVAVWYSRGLYACVRILNRLKTKLYAELDVAKAVANMRNDR